MCGFSATSCGQKQYVSSFPCWRLRGLGRGLGKSGWRCNFAQSSLQFHCAFAKFGSEVVGTSYRSGRQPAQLFSAQLAAEPRAAQGAARRYPVHGIARGPPGLPSHRVVLSCEPMMRQILRTVYDGAGERVLQCVRDAGAHMPPRAASRRARDETRERRECACVSPRATSRDRSLSSLSVTPRSPSRLHIYIEYSQSTPHTGPPQSRVFRETTIRRTARPRAIDAGAPVAGFASRPRLVEGA